MCNERIKLYADFTLYSTFEVPETSPSNAASFLMSVYTAVRIQKFERKKDANSLSHSQVYARRGTRAHSPLWGDSRAKG